MDRHEITVKEVSNILNLDFLGEDVLLDGLNLCNRDSIHKKVLSYVSNENYIECVKENKCISALLLTKQMYELYYPKKKDIAYIISNSPEKDFYFLHEYLYRNTNFYSDFVFEKQIGENCVIANSCFIEDGVIIGDNVTIGQNTVVKKGTVICNNVTIGNNSVIGSEGFQVLKIDGKNVKIDHAGGCYIGESVFISDNVTIGNSMFENTTRIGKNSMIDNHCHIGHNVIIGENVTVTASTVLCGSSIIKNGAWIGVNSTILNRVLVGENSLVGAASVVTKDVNSNTVVYGSPARER